MNDNPYDSGSSWARTEASHIADPNRLSDEDRETTVEVFLDPARKSPMLEVLIGEVDAPRDAIAWLVGELDRAIIRKVEALGQLELRRMNKLDRWGPCGRQTVERDWAQRTLGLGLDSFVEQSDLLEMREALDRQGLAQLEAEQLEELTREPTFRLLGRTLELSDERLNVLFQSVPCPRGIETGRNGGFLSVVYGITRPTRPGDGTRTLFFERELAAAPVATCSTVCLVGDYYSIRAESIRSVTDRIWMPAVQRVQQREHRRLGTTLLDLKQAVEDSVAEHYVAAHGNDEATLRKAIARAVERHAELYVEGFQRFHREVVDTEQAGFIRALSGVLGDTVVSLAVEVLVQAQGPIIGIQGEETAPMILMFLSDYLYPDDPEFSAGIRRAGEMLVAIVASGLSSDGALVSESLSEEFGRAERSAREVLFATLGEIRSRMRSAHYRGRDGSLIEPDSVERAAKLFLAKVSGPRVSQPSQLDYSKLAVHRLHLMKTHAPEDHDQMLGWLQAREDKFQREILSRCRHAELRYGKDYTGYLKVRLRELLAAARR